MAFLRARQHWQKPIVCIGLWALFASPLTYAQNIPLIQKYCSNQNTGSDNQPSFSGFMSLGYCETACQDQYAFAVVSYKTCWCSNYVPYDQLDTSQCTAACPGYPSEDCGGGESSDIYGYVPLRLEPSGTIGSPSAPPDTETKTIILTPSPSTVYLTSVNTIITTATPLATPSQSASSVSVTTSAAVSSVVVTHVVTSVLPVASAGSTGPPIVEQHNGISGGAIAGAIIGVLAAVAVIFALLYFFCWRRRRAGEGSTRSSLARNASVLSKVGLLKNQNSGRQPPYLEEGVAGAAGGMTQRHTPPGNPPRINTQFPEFVSFNEGGPSSAHTGGTSDSRRGSKPLFVDQRLNPYALTGHQNASRSSIGTLEDNQDYSRRLEVKNPDPT